MLPEVLGQFWMHVGARAILPRDVSNRMPPSTLNTYVAGLLQFTQFCDEHHIPENLHMPTLEDHLVLFVSAHGVFKL